MKNFGLDKNYNQIDFEEVSIEELQVISGGSGGWLDHNSLGSMLVRYAGIGAIGGAIGGPGGAIAGAAAGAFLAFDSYYG